jgi:hypothetical protein
VHRVWGWNLSTINDWFVLFLNTFAERYCLARCISSCFAQVENENQTANGAEWIAVIDQRECHQTRGQRPCAINHFNGRTWHCSTAGTLAVVVRVCGCARLTNSAARPLTLRHEAHRKTGLQEEWTLGSFGESSVVQTLSCLLLVEHRSGFCEPSISLAPTNSLMHCNE